MAFRLPSPLSILFIQNSFHTYLLGIFHVTGILVGTRNFFKKCVGYNSYLKRAHSEVEKSAK